MPATFRRLNRKVIDENGEEKFELLATVGVDDTELDIMKGATADVDGVFGLVPTPPKGELNRYLRVDGTWAEPVGDLPSAGSGSSGLMTPDQVKDLQNCVTNITNLTNRLSETSTNLSNKITSVSNSVSSLSTNLSNKITSVSNSVSSLSTNLSNIQTQFNSINNLLTGHGITHTHSGLIAYSSTEVIDINQGFTWNFYTGIGYRPRVCIFYPESSIGDAYLYYDYDASDSSKVVMSIYGNVSKGLIRVGILIPAGI